MYNKNELNAQVEKFVEKDECPYVYSNAVCRCGRPHRGSHLLKCLQTQQNKYLTDNQATENDNNFELPKTSNGFVGWPSKQLPRYKKWENSMKYISPIYDMPGERITTSASYNAIIIG